MTKQRITIGLGCIVGISTLLSSAAIAINAPTQYYLRFGEDHHNLVVELCFNHARHRTILLATAKLTETIGELHATRHDGSTLSLRLQGQRLELPDEQVACINYTVNLPQGRRSDRRSEFNEQNGGMVVDLDRILLRLAAPTSWASTRLSFAAGNAISVLAPGKTLPSINGEARFEFMDRPSTWTGKIAFGALTQNVIEVAGTPVRVAIVGRVVPSVALKLQKWVATGIETLTKLYGRLPVPEIQILVFPLDHNADPVPWGEVLRGGGDAVHLYVDATRSLTELNHNWVLTHELSHLIHPYVAGDDAWLSEGIASYYQNVLRARAGLIEHQLGWQKLDAGFKRGLAQFDRTTTLAQNTRAMLRQGHYMRVYWSGAAIALIGDVTLRQRSNGALGLDSVLDEFSRCCLPSRRRWGARELMAKLDDIAEFEVMIPLYERYVLGSKFPDLKNTYRDLGIAHEKGKLILLDRPAAHLLRTQIMGG